MNRLKINNNLKCLIILFINILLNLNLKSIAYLSTYFCKHNYYKVKEIDPTEESEGKIHFICGLCGKNKVEELPKLNDLTIIH